MDHVGSSGAHVAVGGPTHAIDHIQTTVVGIGAVIACSRRSGGSVIVAKAVVGVLEGKQS